MQRLALSLRQKAGVGAGVVALAVVGAADGWRTALACAVVCAAVLATRLRFAPVAGLALLAVAAVLAVAGRGPADDGRPVPAPPSAGDRPGR